MPYKVSYDTNDNIVIVRISNIATIEDHLAAREQAFKLCKENNCFQLIVDLSEMTFNKMTTMECFSFGESFVEPFIGLRIAHVMPVDSKSRADVRFASTVESNRGNFTGEFETIVEARKWLLGR